MNYSESARSTTAMEENQFFRFVWRFNAIAIMASTLLVLGSLMFMLAGEILGNVKRQHRGIVNVEDNAEIKEELEINSYREVKGTDYLIFPLDSQQSYSRGSYSKKTTSSTRNLLFVNSRTNAKRWLLPDNNNLIISDRPLVEASNKNSPTQAILYTLVTEDSNQDQRLTASDLQTISISSADGKNYQEIVAGVNQFLGYKSLNNSQIAVIYQQQQGIYSQLINLAQNDFSIITKPHIIYQPDN